MSAGAGNTAIAMVLELPSTIGVDSLMMVMKAMMMTTMMMMVLLLLITELAAQALGLRFWGLGI